MSGAERERLRERVAAGIASDEELDRLAGLLAHPLRSRDELEPEARAQLLVELEELVERAQRPSCTDALLGVLLDQQIRAFERRDPAQAWAQLDRIRARWLQGEAEGSPLVDDRLAAALFNTVRGGELLGDPAMRLAALEELQTRSYVDEGASACRLALAELLADAMATAAREQDLDAGERALARLRRLALREPSLGLARELGRGLRELARGQLRPLATILAELDAAVAAHEPSGDDPLLRRLAEVLVLAHAEALRGDDEPLAERLRERLQVLVSRPPRPPDQGRDARPISALVHELGKALHDAAVLGFMGERPARALAELRALVERHTHDDELRAQLMSALFQIHRHAIEADELDRAEQLQAEADALLASEGPLEPVPVPAVAGEAGAGRSGARQRRELARLELRFDHLRMLLASHALAGDRGDWDRADQLLARARGLVAEAGAPLVTVELLGQMLVNAHVDVGAEESGAGEARTEPLADAEPRDARAEAILIELRELARANPHSPSLQLHLATALFNAHVEAGRRGQRVAGDRLLAELERLHHDHPGQLELRRRLVMALVNHHGDRLEREDFDRASTLLARLRELVRSPDADNHLRMQLAMALGNTLAHVDDPGCREDDARIVGELRVLAAREDASDSLRALVLDELSDRFAPRQ